MQSTELAYRHSTFQDNTTGSIRDSLAVYERCVASQRLRRLTPNRPINSGSRAALCAREQVYWAPRATSPTVGRTSVEGVYQHDADDYSDLACSEILSSSSSDCSTQEYPDESRPSSTQDIVHSAIHRGTSNLMTLRQSAGELTYLTSPSQSNSGCESEDDNESHMGSYINEAFRDYDTDEDLMTVDILSTDLADAGDYISDSDSNENWPDGNEATGGDQGHSQGNHDHQNTNSNDAGTIDNSGAGAGGDGDDPDDHSSDNGKDDDSDDEQDEDPMDKEQDEENDVDNAVNAIVTSTPQLNPGAEDFIPAAPIHNESIIQHETSEPWVLYRRAKSAEPAPVSCVRYSRPVYETHALQVPMICTTQTREEGGSSNCSTVADNPVGLTLQHAYETHALQVPMICTTQTREEGGSSNCSTVADNPVGLTLQHAYETHALQVPMICTTQTREEGGPSNCYTVADNPVSLTLQHAMERVDLEAKLAASYSNIMARHQREAWDCAMANALPPEMGIDLSKFYQSCDYNWKNGIPEEDRVAWSSTPGGSAHASYIDKSRDGRWTGTWTPSDNRFVGIQFCAKKDHRGASSHRLSHYRKSINFITSSFRLHACQ
jgi:hypothetical protein